MKKLCLLSAVYAGVLFAPLIANAQNSAPVVDAGPDQWIFTDNYTTLQGSATDADGQPIAAWEWTIENAPAGSTPQVLYPHMPDPQFTTDTAGQHDLSLLATDGVEWSDPDYMSVFVADIVGQSIIDATPTSGVEPLTVQFDGSSSFIGLFDGTSVIDAVGSPWDDGSFGLSYLWDFGDSTQSNEISPEHIYQNPGTYTAVLIARSDTPSGWVFSDQASIKITVNAVPVPAAVWLFGSGLLGLVGIARRSRKTV